MMQSYWRVVALVIVGLALMGTAVLSARVGNRGYGTLPELAAQVSMAVAAMLAVGLT